MKPKKPEPLISLADEKWMEKRRKLTIPEPLGDWEIECRKLALVEALHKWALSNREKLIQAKQAQP